MDVFDWLKEIEKVYEDLINNSKVINLKDIEEFREQHIKRFEFFLEEKNELVNKAIMIIASDINKETKLFENQIDTALNHIKTEFQKEIENLHKLIIEEIGLDF
ncbi:hypothetical protein LCGC14_0932050 [marine sediment metagenome]|uniref:Uncharacterized protein n=1 Tax=marine sediment metagenome TaxID=412755 RepID=A0A0F9NSB0_9ZZZZ